MGRIARDPCYTDPVPAKKHNLTIALDEDLLHRARLYAVARKTSVNQLVREYLESLAAEERERERRLKAVEELRAMMEKGLYELGEITWTRDELYDRD
jgi:hypothetical protein